MRRHLAGLVLCLALAPEAGGQAILGTYVTTPAPGGGAPATLVLQKDAQGRVTGSLSGNGVSFSVLGELRGQDVAGLLMGGGMRSYFEARLAASQLRLLMADIGADGKPDYAKARTVMFTARDAAAGAAAVGGGAAANPMAGSSATPGAGNPLAGGGAERFAGTFAGSDVTLSLTKNGAGYAGTLRYRGEVYPAVGRAVGESLTGAFQAGGRSYELAVAASADGKFVNLTTGGATYLLARTGAADANPMSVGGSAAPSTGGAAGPGAATGQDRQLATFLMSSAWCSFSYSGSSTYSGTSSGTTQSSRAVFRPDGVLTEGRNGETTNSGSAGSVYGNNANGQQFRWKVENGQLMLSANGIQWVPQPLKIERNSSGYPIVTTSGKEYMMCR